MATIIKPIISVEVAENCIKEYFGLKVHQVKELDGYDDANFLCEIEDTLGVKRKTILKITNDLNTSNPFELEAQNEAMFYCGKRGVHVPVPIKNLYGTHVHRAKFPNQKILAIRLLEYVPGELFLNMSPDKQLLQQTGFSIHQISKVLSQFNNQVLKQRSFSWALSKCVELRDILEYVKEKWHKPINQVLDNFEEKVLKRMDELQQSIIHGDLNEYNLLVNKNSTNNQTHYEVAIIDFGDLHWAPTIFDLAIGIAYVLIQFYDFKQFCVVNEILKGYEKLGTLSEKDKFILPICVKARIIQSFVLGMYHAHLNPDNEYVVKCALKAENALEYIIKFEDTELIKKWLPES